jgi:hypothetical protein
MAAKKTEDQNTEHARKHKNQASNDDKPAGIYIAALAVAIAILAFGVFVYLSRSSAYGNKATLESFKNSFFSAKHVGIYISYPNSTVFVSSEACATKIIEQITASKTNHVAPSEISFYILNSTSCTYLQHLGNSTANALTSQPSSCLNQSLAQPSIFINYSNTNGTTITSGRLYFHGTALYLSECPIAYELP